MNSRPDLGAAPFSDVERRHGQLLEVEMLRTAETSPVPTMSQASRQVPG
jgi:hypothetical protein